MASYGPPSSIILISVGDNRVAVMAALREVRSDLDLRSAKDFIRQLPRTVADDIDSDVAPALARRLRAAGATVEVKRPMIRTDLRNWLQTRTTVAAEEAAYLAALPPGAQNVRVFGGVHEDWRRLKAQMQPGDELWKFCSPAINWEYMCGREGFALLRDGKAISAVITKMN